MRTAALNVAQQCLALAMRRVGAQMLPVCCATVLAEEGGRGGSVGGAQLCGAAAAARQGARRAGGSHAARRVGGLLHPDAGEPARQQPADASECGGLTFGSYSVRFSGAVTVHGTCCWTRPGSRFLHV